MKVKQDWKLIGRFVATLVQLFTAISAVFKRADVGLEIIEWCVGGGKDYFAHMIADMVMEYMRQNPYVPPPLKIDRSSPFNPASFIGYHEWGIWRGAKDGDGLRGEEEQDGRSLAITEIDIKKFVFQTGLEEGKTSITGEARLAKLILSRIQADAKIAEVLLKEKDQVTLRWIHKTFGVTRFEFLGTVLRDKHGQRYILCLYLRDDNGLWNYYPYWLGDHRDASRPALCLESSQA